jgi:excisionase family DNA binding protein
MSGQPVAIYTFSAPEIKTLLITAAKMGAEQALASVRADGPLSVAEAAKALGISTRTAHRQISRGLLRATKIGSRTVIPRSEIDRVLDAEAAYEQDPRTFQGAE